MRRFLLIRSKDETGISGTGVVAEGVEFLNEKCTLAWTAELSSVVVYDSIGLVDKIHGHNGKTIIFWVDDMHKEVSNIPEV